MYIYVYIYMYIYMYIYIYTCIDIYTDKSEYVYRCNACNSFVEADTSVI